MKRTNITKPLFFRIFGMIVFCLSLGGCIKDDYSDCPAGEFFDLRVTFYNQTVNNTFANEITRLDFFIFDENDLYLSRIVDVAGPFTNEYKKSLHLPFGKYKIVVWGNLYDDAEVVGKLVAGASSIGDLQIKVVTSGTRADTQPGEGYPKLENFVKAIPTTTFYGITDYIVFRGKYSEQQVDLLKNTKDIHVILRWKNYEGFYDYSTEHQRTTRAYVIGSNGESGFDNKLARERNITYLPFYRDPSDEDLWWGQTAGSYIPPQIIVKDHVSVLPDFRLMRLTADGSTEKLIVTTLLPDGTEKIVYARSIVDLIRLTGHYNTQAQIDQTNDYIITVDFRCVDENHQHGSTWIAATIWLNGWVVKEVDSEI